MKQWLLAALLALVLPLSACRVAAPEALEEVPLLDAADEWADDTYIEPPCAAKDGDDCELEEGPADDETVPADRPDEPDLEDSPPGTSPST